MPEADVWRREERSYTREQSKKSPQGNAAALMGLGPRSYDGHMTHPCPFCSLSSLDVVASSTHSLAIRDAYPVSQGHTLVVPRVHVLSLVHLPGPAQSDLLRLAFKVRQDLQAELAPHGFTIGLNDGEAAGQTVPHAHIHVIPRWMGDVPDPRGGIRWVLPEKADYWVDQRKAEDDLSET